MSDGRVLVGVRGVDHVGLTVPDLDVVHDFFTRVLGCEYLYRWVYFRSPWGLQLELVSYPGGKAFDHDPGAFA
jgi:glyoxylase I family protein